MRALLAAVGTRGDVQPLAVLARALVDAGHDALVAAPHEARGVVEAQGVRHVACGVDVAGALMSMNVAEIGPLRALRSFQGLFAGDLLAQMQILADASAGVDVVVTGGGQLLGTAVAELRGVKSAYAYYAPTLLPSSQHPPFLVPWQGLPRVVNRWLHRAMYRLLNKATIEAVNAARAVVKLAPIDDVTRTLPADLLAAWDPALAPVPDDVHETWNAWGIAPTLHEVGALQSAAAPLGHDVEAMLSADPRPAIYVGFGSMPDARPGETAALVEDAAQRAGARAIVNNMRSGVSHASLFPRMRGVVHHGGAGTTATAARAGVPQIIVPHFIDQPFWAQRAEALGVAPPHIHKKRLTAPRLALAISRCLDDAALQSNARALAGALVSAPDPRTIAVALVERLAA